MRYLDTGDIYRVIKELGENLHITQLIVSGNELW